MHQLSGHHGCVNSLGWSQEGVLLASGSDDTKICVWNPLDKAKTLVSKIVSGHRANIFQSKFLPNSSNMKIVTTGRDGEVRLAQLDETGQAVPFSSSSSSPTRLLAKHDQAAHKLNFIPQTEAILSCGEDGKVYRIDPRTDCRNREVVVNLPLSLYTIDCSPSYPHFAVAGQCEQTFIYDLRTVARFMKNINKFMV